MKYTVDEHVEKMPNKFEPLRVFRFVVNIDGVEPFMVRNLDLGDFSVDGEDSVMTLGLHLATGVPLTSKLLDWMKEADRHEYSTAWRDCTVKLLENDGTVTDEYTWLVSPVKLTFTKLDYNRNDRFEAVLTLKRVWSE